MVLYVNGSGRTVLGLPNAARTVTGCPSFQALRLSIYLCLGIPLKVDRYRLTNPTASLAIGGQIARIRIYSYDLHR